MYTDHQGTDDQCGPRSATCQCSSVPVPISATCQCPSVHTSAHLSCLPMSPISASQCHLSMLISAANQCHLSVPVSVT
ncbi:unnamed protein product, partial [Staurois parvus]